MKALFKDYFEVQEEKPVGDKAMLGRAVTTLVSVLVILCLMGVTAYAYFGVNATSPSIPVAAAHFEAELSLSVTDDQGTRDMVSGESAAKHSVNLKAGKTYTFTLKPAGTARGGFCSITASNCDTTYHTQQLGADAAVSGGKTSKIEFTIVPTADTVLTLDTSWGTSTFYGRVDKSDDRYIFNGDHVTMVIAGVQLPVTEDEEDATEPTQPTEPVQPEGKPNEPTETTPVETAPAETEAVPTEETTTQNSIEETTE